MPFSEGYAEGCMLKYTSLPRFAFRQYGTASNSRRFTVSFISP
jgi:hypothetical protein